MTYTKHIAVWVLSALFTAVVALQMLYLNVPAVIEVRPRLAEVGFWTGMFSGRAATYLWYHYPEAGVGVTFVAALIASYIVLATR